MLIFNNCTATSCTKVQMIHSEKVGLIIVEFIYKSCLNTFYNYWSTSSLALNFGQPVFDLSKITYIGHCILPLY